MKEQYPDFIPVCAELARRAWKSIKVIASKVYELVQPPPDLKVHSTMGHVYSGVVVVDRNEVEGGAVAKVGFDASTANGPYGSGGLITPPPRRRDYDESPYLRSWAEDPRQEDDPWPPR